MNTLVIVESPHKANTIKSFLGKGYKVKSSKGHVRDLPKSKLGIDIDNDFEPQYINIRGKGDLINELRKEAKAADRVFLAADPDREGEAISWHLANVLSLDPAKTKRITFNEITKNTVKEAIKHPRDIDMNLVNSQQTRRILDRLVGYKISPFLWKHIKNGLSAGRVQSVATRIVVEREQEIDAFVPEEFWVIGATFVTENGEFFKAKFYGKDGKKLELNNESEVNAVLSAIDKNNFTIDSVKRALKQRRPAPPFITSTLQQEANRKLSFQSQKTMLIAQELYEGVNIGEKSTHGLITYMRTDSLRISDEARESAKNVIIENYGKEYYPATPNKYKLKKNAQDAHEAIRPTDPTITPDSLRGKITNDQYKLYKLIWERFIASQMAPELLDTVTADIVSNGCIFRANGHSVKFKGFAAVYGDIPDDNNDEESGSMLPELTEGEKLTASEINPEQKFTQPPSRFTEGSLIKVLEDKGIGRPSTYTATITTIISRGYIRRDGKYLVPTDLGVITTETMKKAFSHIVDYKFTAEMEEDLDKIEDGSSEYIAVLHEFYRHFSAQLDEAEKTLGSERVELPKVETGIICEKCGAVMVEKTGRYGKFAACPNYPRCRNTKRLDAEPAKEAESGNANGKKSPEVLADEKCPNCGNDMILRKGPHGNFFACRNYPDCKTTMPYRRDSGIVCPDCGKRIMIKQTKSRKTYYACEDYPKCGFSSWDLPTERKCPICGAPALKKKTREFYYCKNNCGWSEGE